MTKNNSYRHISRHTSKSGWIFNIPENMRTMLQKSNARTLYYGDKTHGDRTAALHQAMLERDIMFATAEITVK